MPWIDRVIRAPLVRAVRSLPSAGLAGLAAGLALPLLVLADAILGEIALSARLARTAMVFGLTGLIAATLAWIAAAAAAGHRPPSARLAAMLAAQTLATAATLTLIHRLIIRIEDGDPWRFGPGALLEEVFGNISSAYVVLVAGLPKILPLGALLLIGTAAVFARRRRG